MSKNPILAAIGEDSNRFITGGAELPSRDNYGRRSFNVGETKLLQLHEPKMRQIQNDLKRSQKELRIGEATHKILGVELDRLTSTFAIEQKEDEAEYERVNSQLEQMDLASTTSTTKGLISEEKSQRTNKKIKANGLISFLLVAFIAECVAFLATFNLQQENLSTDAIWWRLAYIGVIYVYTIILYLRYVKTRNNTIKGLLVGCILLGFVCLLHAIAVSFLNCDVVSTTNNSEFSLNQLDTVEAETNASLLSVLISKPGLGEFLLATLLVFVGEIVVIDDGNRKEITETSSEIVSAPLEESSLVDFRKASQENLNLHFSVLKDRKIKLGERLNQRIAEFNNHVNGIKAKLEDNEQKMELAKNECEKDQYEMDQLLDTVVLDLANYRNLLLEDIAFRLGKEKRSFKYEPATKEDVRVHGKLQLTLN